MMTKKYFSTAAATALLLFVTASPAEVKRLPSSPLNEITFVSNESWQPDDFVNGTTIPAVKLDATPITVDGDGSDPAWSATSEIEVPLSYGKVDRAWVSALYTEDDVFIRVRWADKTEDREHRPWTWNSEKEQYEEGPQIEDSVMLSFEAGCEWTPSLLGGHINDFDAWHWLAARSDPVGQALDLYGNIRNQEKRQPGFEPYDSRVTEQDLLLKFTENQGYSKMNADWSELDRVYIREPIHHKLWVRAVPDGGKHAPDYVKTLAAPMAPPENPLQTYPQFSPIKLTGEAAEVSARGQWKDGYWTVEFKRALETPVGHIYDVIFNRLIQFSVNVFDRSDRLDQASESDRLFLRFMPAEEIVQPDDKLLASE